MKNKFSNIIKTLFLAIICTFSITNVFAQTNMNITKKSYIDTGIGSRKEAKFYTNKGYAYCITPDKTGPKQGTSLKYAKRETSGGVLYLLSKAGTSDSDYLITQLAMWKYNSNYTPDIYQKNSNNSYVKKAMSLANEAAKNNNYSTDPTISFKPSSQMLTLTSDGKYYKSEKLTVNTTNTGAIILSLSNAPSGSATVDANNNAKTTVSSGEAFYIRVPANAVTKSMTINFKATAKGKVSYIETYSTGSSKWQDLVVLTQEDKTVTANATFTLTKKEGTSKPETHNCVIYDGKYYDNTGNVTNKEGYETNCIKHTCEKFGDYYFDKSGNKVSKTEYEKQCVIHKCVIFDGQYYDKEGKVVDKATYEAKCITQPVTHTCEKYDDKYYGKDGKETTKEDYETNCIKHICEFFGGKYFGKDGKVISQTEYENECVHVCEIYDGKYYGSEGTEVSETEYSTKCVKHTCEFFNNNYFDRNGNIVSQQEFENQCVHVCEIYDNHYYGKNGDIVNESDYKSQCEAQIVPVPDTASISPITLLFIIIGSGILGGTASVLYNIKSNSTAR